MTVAPVTGFFLNCAKAQKDKHYSKLIDIVHDPGSRRQLFIEMHIQKGLVTQYQDTKRLQVISRSMHCYRDIKIEHEWTISINTETKARQIARNIKAVVIIMPQKHDNSYEATNRNTGGSYISY